MWEEYQGPGAHVIACISTLRGEDADITQYFSPHCSSKEYEKTYSRPIEPYIMDSLILDTSILPPIVERDHGRPKSKRTRKKDYHTKPKNHCGKCKKLVRHNIRTCPEPPADHNNSDDEPLFPTPPIRALRVRKPLQVIEVDEDSDSDLSEGFEPESREEEEEEEDSDNSEGSDSEEENEDIIDEDASD